jgi:iron-sulfur cluster repair protein YtfE (RIC family)
MLDRKMLSAEHDELATLAAELVARVASADPAPEAIAPLRWQLTRKLLAHLAKEDTLLYPRLIAGSDRRAAMMAARFADEMGDLAQSYREYVANWSSDRIVAEWAGFGNETRRVMQALTQRIGREETMLYALIPPPERQRTVA